MCRGTGPRRSTWEGVPLVRLWRVFMTMRMRFTSGSKKVISFRVAYQNNASEVDYTVKGKLWNLEIWFILEPQVEPGPTTVGSLGPYYRLRFHPTRSYSFPVFQNSRVTVTQSFSGSVRILVTSWYLRLADWNQTIFQSSYAEYFGPTELITLSCSDSDQWTIAVMIVVL